MKNNNFFTKFVFMALIAFLLSSLAAPAIFSQTPASVPQQEKLLNGLKLLMWSDQKSDKVTMKIRIHAGSAFDPKGKEGVMKLLAADIFPNPETKEFFRDDLGGSLEVISNYDYIQINATAKADSFLTMLDTIAPAVSNPTIDKETTAKMKAALLKQVDELEKDPAYVADQAAAQRLFGTFPYGRPENGTAASIRNIDFADLIGAKQRFLSADNATITLSGKFDSNLGFRAVRRYFGSWLKSDKRVPSTFRQPDDPPQSLQIIDSPVPERFELRFATRGTAKNSADFATTQILAAILEARLKAFLPAEYRDKAAIASEYHTLPGMILFRFWGAASNNTAMPKIEATDLVARTLATNVADAEFSNARSTFASNWNMRDNAENWLDLDTFKTDAVAKEQEKISSVSLADLQRVLARIQKQPVVSVLVSSQKAAN